MRSAHPTHGGKTYGAKCAARSQSTRRTYWVPATGLAPSGQNIQQLGKQQGLGKWFENPLIRAQCDLTAVAAACRGGSHVSAGSQESPGARRCFNGIVCVSGARGGTSLLPQRVGEFDGNGGRRRTGGLHKLALIRLPFITQLATGRE